MIRFAWQQFRIQAAIALAALVAVAAIVLVTGPQLARLYRLHETVSLLNKYGTFEDTCSLARPRSRRRPSTPGSTRRAILSRRSRMRSLTKFGLWEDFDGSQDEQVGVTPDSIFS